jgi:iron complex outermembrane receptor protein
VYSITENTGLKLSYARSFVDAPYWYRYNSLPSYQGAENLLPEHLESYQLTSDIDLMNHKLSICANVFYNKLRDFIYRIPEASGDDIRYKNAGMLKLTGIEGEASLLLQKIKIHANVCVLSLIDSKDYGVTDDKIDNIAPITANMLVSYNFLKRKKTDVIVSANLRYASQQSAPLNTYLNGNPYVYPDNTIPERLLADASTIILFKKLIRLKITVSNLFNKKYEQGGSVNFPYPQKGRWVKISLSLKIKNV